MQFSPSTIPSNAAFERIKGLAGEWEAPYRGKTMKDTFRVVGNGSAVLHTESFDGDLSGAVTLIYPVGDELRADHYCDLHNQPRFVAHTSSDANVVAFKLRDVTNLVPPGAEYFHALTIHFVDANHHWQEWEWFKDGKLKEILRMDFSRKK